MSALGAEDRMGLSGVPGVTQSPQGRGQAAVGLLWAPADLPRGPRTRGLGLGHHCSMFLTSSHRGPGWLDSALFTPF